MFDWVLKTLLNLNITLKNLKNVLLYLQKYILSESLVVYTYMQKRGWSNAN